MSDLAGPALERSAAAPGEILARAHARTGDAAALAGFAGAPDRPDRAIARFGMRHADPTHDGYGPFRAGVLKAAPRREAIAHGIGAWYAET